jgi:hypothetical protein
MQYGVIEMIHGATTGENNFGRTEKVPVLQCSSTGFGAVLTKGIATDERRLDKKTGGL